MLTDAFRETSLGVPIKYRCDGKLFNLRCLQNVTKVKETVVCDLLFTDDCAPNAINEQETQQETDAFSSACDNFRLIYKLRSFTKKKKKGNHLSECNYRPVSALPCLSKIIEGVILSAISPNTYLVFEMEY